MQKKKQRFGTKNRNNLAQEWNPYNVVGRIEGFPDNISENIQ